MTKFDINDIEEKEFLTPTVLRYIDRLSDIQFYTRKLKIHKVKGETNKVEFLVLMEDEQGNKTLAIYMMAYYEMGNRIATLNSPRMVKSAVFYDVSDVESIWNKR
jgi:hypothetical protein